MDSGGWDLLKDEPPRHPGGGEPPVGSDGRDTVPWTAWDVIIVVVLVIAVFLASFVILGGLLALFSSDPADTVSEDSPDSAVLVTFLMVMQWVITLAVPLLYFRIRGYTITLRNLGFRRTGAGKALLWLLVILAATLAFGAGYDWLVRQLAGEGALPSSVPSQDVTSLYGTSALAIVLTFIAVALVTPVVEELFFRGIVHRGLEQGLGFLPGASISAFIFALAHIDPRLFIPIFALGFGFAYLVHKTGSIWPSIGGHFVINSLGVIAQYVDINGGP